MSILDEYRVRADMRKQWRTASPNVDRCRDDAEKLLSALEAIQGMPEALDNSAYSYGWDDARMATARAIREALNG